MLVFRRSIGVLFLASLACAGPVGPDGPLALNTTWDVAVVVEQLEATGATVENAGLIGEPLFPATATLLLVDGEELQVHVFETAAAAANAGVPLVQWAAPPHFFRTDRVIGLYVGSTDALLERLETVFGPELPQQ